MRALVTGATGFLGARLTRHLLATGWEVDALVRDADRARDLEGAGARLVVATDPVEVASAVAGSRADAIAHLATHFLRGHSAADIGPLMRANVEFGTAVLDGASVLGCPVVTASSFFQFRGSEPHPTSLYAASKQAFTAVADFYRERGLPVRDVVLYDTYGPGDTRDKLVPLLVDSVRSGGALRLGAPAQPINLCYAQDVVEGLAVLLTTEPGGRTSIRASEPTTVGEVARILTLLAGTEPDIGFTAGAPVNDLPLVAGEWPAPPGWSARTDLQTGLALSLANGDSSEG